MGQQNHQRDDDEALNNGQGQDDDVIETGFDDESRPGDDEDRGNNPNPELTADNLRRVAGTDDDGDDDDDGDGDDKRESSIPRSRFDEVNERRKIAEATMARQAEELEALRAASKQGQQQQDQAEEQGAKVVEFDFEAKEGEYLDAVMEGDTDKAKSIRREINTALTTQIRQNSLAEARELVRAESQQQRVSEAAEAVISAYPLLDSTSKDADQDAIADVVDLRDTYIRRGKDPVQAMIDAANKVARMNGWKPADENSGDGDDDSDGNNTRQAPKNGSRTEDRRAQSVSRGAAAQRNQPDIRSGVGQRVKEGTLDVSKMSDDEFERLSETEKSRLRGD